MPSRCAIATTTLGPPTRSSRRTETVLSDWASASSIVTSPRNRPSKSDGDQFPSRIGASSTVSSGRTPASSAAAQTKGLNDEPGWRRASTARL